MTSGQTARMIQPLLRRRVASVAVALVMATGVLGCGSEGDSSSSQLGSVRLRPLGDAPALQLGERTDAPTVVNVWATWCVPCRKELPAFNRAADELDGEVRFVGVNLGEERAAAEQFVDEVDATFDQYLNPDMSIQQAFEIVSMPTTVVIGADGTIAARHDGALDDESLAELVERATRR